MMLHFLNDVVNDAESAQKSKNYAIFANLKRKTIHKLINRIPGSRFDIKFTRLSFENAC